MLWTLLLLNEFDLIFHDDFSTTAKRYEGWTLVGDTAQQNLGLVRPGEQVLLDGQGIQKATLRLAGRPSQCGRGRRVAGRRAGHRPARSPRPSD